MFEARHQELVSILLDFDWGNYGLDDVAEAPFKQWADHLALAIMRGKIDEGSEVPSGDIQARRRPADTESPS
jgi:hypothetical protein